MSGTGFLPGVKVVVTYQFGSPIPIALGDYGRPPPPTGRSPSRSRRTVSTVPASCRRLICPWSSRRQTARTVQPVGARSSAASTAR
jgi:hypothetical protein